MSAARLTQKTIVVTGASSGIGAAIAAAAAREGAAVVGFARRFPEGRVASAPPAGQISQVALDVTDEEQVRGRFAELGEIDAVVCCAGVGSFKPIADSGVAELRQMLDVHVVGAFLCARELLLRAAAAPGRTRHIVNVSSVAALRTFTGCGGYSAAKEGLRGFTRVLAEEGRPLDVRVVGLYPGAVDTPIWDTREGFDRADMLPAARVAELVIEVLVRPELSVEELVVMPPKGAL